jgi:hypothetical protein
MASFADVVALSLWFFPALVLVSLVRQTWHGHSLCFLFPFTYGLVWHPESSIGPLGMGGILGDSLVLVLVYPRAWATATATAFAWMARGIARASTWTWGDISNGAFDFLFPFSSLVYGLPPEMGMGGIFYAVLDFLLGFPVLASPSWH